MASIKQILEILQEKDETIRTRLIAKLSSADAKEVLRYVLNEKFKVPEERL
ncbi:MAG: hypothetical protein RR709_08670 [Ruthenibacterium sp.]